MGQNASLFPDSKLPKPHPGEGKIELFDDVGASRGFYSPKNRLNELTGKEWQYWSKSVINKVYPVNIQHKLRSEHGGQKPPELCADLIKIFTKKGMKVLDPYAGVGGTLLGASLVGREATGVEINKKWANIYEQVCKLEKIPCQKMLVGDSKKILKKLKQDSYDFVLTDVPYWDMDRVERSKGKFKRAGQIATQKTQSKLSTFNKLESQSKQEWLNDMREVFILSRSLLKSGGYMAVFIGDMYKNGRYHLLSGDLFHLLEEIGLTPKANLIWYDVSNRLHIYGYQYEYIPSMIHQNILIFKNS